MWNELGLKHYLRILLQDVLESLRFDYPFNLAMLSVLCRS
jgi:hypothetical protein